MAVSVEVPNLGEAMAGGLVAEWYRADGAVVGLGEIVCRVESAYVAFEVEAEGEGTLRHEKPAGSIERPGAVLGLILAAGESMPAARIDGRESRRADVEPEDQEWPLAPASELIQSVEPAHDLEAGRATPEALVEVESADDPGAEPEADEPPEEFAAALREAVVVPFPRRFAEPLANGQAEELPEPGGSIPGLPLWEPDDAGGGKAPSSAAVERFGRTASAAAADAQVLHATILVEVSEATRLAVVCEREWRCSPAPLIEDVMFRAIAFALRESAGADGIGGMLVAESESDVSMALASPAALPFREIVVRRESGGDAAFESASWILVSVARQGVHSCTPRLEHGRKLAFAMGAADASRHAALTVAFDSLAWSEGSAARLLARIRELFESPYAMLI